MQHPDISYHGGYELRHVQFLESQLSVMQEKLIEARRIEYAASAGYNNLKREIAIYTLRANGVYYKRKPDVVIQYSDGDVAAILEDIRDDSIVVRQRSKRGKINKTMRALNLRMAKHIKLAAN